MKKFISMVLLLAMSLSAMAFNPAYAEEEPETVKATLTADTYADCRNNPTLNYGAAEYLFVKRTGNT